MNLTPEQQQQAETFINSNDMADVDKGMAILNGTAPQEPITPPAQQYQEQAVQQPIPVVPQTNEVVPPPVQQQPIQQQVPPVQQPVQQQVPPVQQQVQQQQPPIQQQTQEQAQQLVQQQKTLYNIDYNGKQVGINDSDGYLGYKSVDGMKKSLAHTKTFSDQVLSEKRVLNDTVLDLQAKIAGYEAQKQVPPPVQQPITTQVDVQQNQNQLVPPAYPTDLPKDTMEWTDEDHNKFAQYNRLAVEHNQNITNKIFTLEEKINNNDQFIQSQKTFEEQRKVQEQQKQRWDGMQNFRLSHSKYNESNRTLDEIHSDMTKWANNAAAAAGIYAKGQDEASIADYNMRKENLVERFRQKDPDTVNHINTVTPPPEGYGDYFHMVNLVNKHEDYKANGVLGNNSTLDQAFYLENINNGTLDKTVEQKSVAAHKEGQNSFVNAIQQQQQTYAQPLAVQPNNEPPPQQTNNDILKMPYDQVANNPELKEQWDQATIRVSMAQFNGR